MSEQHCKGKQLVLFNFNELNALHNDSPAGRSSNISEREKTYDEY